MITYYVYVGIEKIAPLIFIAEENPTVFFLSLTKDQNLVGSDDKFHCVLNIYFCN